MSDGSSYSFSELKQDMHFTPTLKKVMSKNYWPAKEITLDI